MDQSKSGTLKLDTKSLLEQVPIWENLKVKAEENNHRSDHKSAMDKTLKSAQQKWVNMLRLLAALHSTLTEAPPEIQGLSQQLFAYAPGAETDLVKESKRRSIPGTIQQPNGLFSNEDIRTANDTIKINRQSGFNGMPVGESKMWHFPTNTGQRQWKFKPGNQWRGPPSSSVRAWPWRPYGKGKGKGKGKPCTASFFKSLSSSCQIPNQSGKPAWKAFQWHCSPAEWHCAQKYGDCPLSRPQPFVASNFDPGQFTSRSATFSTSAGKVALVEG